MVETCTLVAIGSIGVGKTAYINRMFYGRVGSTYPTVKAVVKTHNMILDGRTVEFRIWDCPGRNHHLLMDLYTQANGIFLIYDVTDRRSYTQATSTFLNLIRTYCQPNIMITLIGTKVDLHTTRQVPTVEAHTFALHQHLYFQEISSLTGVETDFIPTPAPPPRTPTQTSTRSHSHTRPYPECPTPIRFPHSPPLPYQ